MKKFLYPLTALLFFSCSSDEILQNESQQKGEVPIAFNTFRQNVTRAGNLEEHEHYNFGVWAYKVSANQNAQSVMDNYLVGFSDGQSKGYDKTNGTTWADQAGTTSDHKSQWFYENLGKSQYNYTGNAGFYTSSQTAYMSGNDNQYLRYWDLSYTNTNFYCYTPYKASGVTCTVQNDGSASMEFGGTSLQDRYENPLNSAYAGARSDRSLTEFMYAGVQATNSALSDIIVPFKHMGAQLFLRFYEDVPGYKVELIELTGDGASVASGATGDMLNGIQATPSVETVSGTSKTYAKGSYYTTSGATISFDKNAVATFAPSSTGATSTQDNLMFFLPSETATYPTVNVPAGFQANLTDYAGTGSTVHKQIVEKVPSGSDQTYSWSPTIYYPVAQPADQKTGFTFHVSYRLIAEDNKEVITVHNATVFVPADVAAWAGNTRYTYTFRITTHSSGSTSPSEVIDPTDPTPGSVDTIYPIVFDNCTIEDYTNADPSEIPVN